MGLSRGLLSIVLHTFRLIRLSAFPDLNRSITRSGGKDILVGENGLCSNDPDCDDGSSVALQYSREDPALAMALPDPSSFVC